LLTFKELLLCCHFVFKAPLIKAYFFRLFGGNDMESIFHAIQQDGSEWAIKQLEILKKMV